MCFCIIILSKFQVEKKDDEPISGKDKKDDDNVPGAGKTVAVNLTKEGSTITSGVPEKQRREVQAKINKNEGADGPYGTTAGRKAIQGFFSDTFGIKDIEVDYSYPREGESQDKKKGGKVTAKKKKKASYGKKYSMNRGGMASLRKPTRV